MVLPSLQLQPTVSWHFQQIKHCRRGDPLKISTFGGYVDDTFLVWHHGQEAFNELYNFFNKLHPSITMELKDWKTCPSQMQLHIEDLTRLWATGYVENQSILTSTLMQRVAIILHRSGRLCLPWSAEHMWCLTHYRQNLTFCKKTLGVVSMGWRDIKWTLKYKKQVLTRWMKLGLKNGWRCFLYMKGFSQSWEAGRKYQTSREDQAIVASIERLSGTACVWDLWDTMWLYACRTKWKICYRKSIGTCHGYSVETA